MVLSYLRYNGNLWAAERTYKDRREPKCNFSRVRIDHFLNKKSILNREPVELFGKSKQFCLEFVTLRYLVSRYYSVNSHKMKFT